ncbi:MAG: hypothetical protein WD066_04390 [Planctomycetaceae bacterium]
MIRVLMIVMLLGAALPSAGMSGVPRAIAATIAEEDGPEKPAVKAVEHYEGFEADRASLRKTVQLGGGPGQHPAVNASRGEAIAAADRIFRNVPFLFKTRQDVLDILGDPATISDYGQRPADRPDSPLVYRFDHGYGGYQYTLGFDSGRVCEIRVQGIH